MRSVLRSLTLGAVLLGLTSGHLAAQANPFVGTWKMDVTKWTGTPGPAPKAVTVKTEVAGKAFKTTVTGTGADGKPINMSYTVAYDGKDAAVAGSADYDAMNVTMINANTRHSVRKKGGKEVMTVHSVMSKDGKHYTATTTGVNAKGEKVNTTAVYDRQ
jgi:hypothetical protein